MQVARRRRKSPFLAAHPQTSCPAVRARSPFWEQCDDGEEEIPSSTQRQTHLECWKLGKVADLGWVPHSEENCLNGKRCCHSLGSALILQMEAPALAHSVPALTTDCSGELMSPLCLLRISSGSKCLTVASAALNHPGAQTHRLFLPFQSTPKWNVEAVRLKIQAEPLPSLQELRVIQFLLMLQAQPPSELFFCYFTFITWAVTARMCTTGKLHLDSCTFVFQAGPMQLLKESLAKALMQDNQTKGWKALQILAAAAAILFLSQFFTQILSQRTHLNLPPPPRPTASQSHVCSPFGSVYGTDCCAAHKVIALSIWSAMR